MLTRPLSLGLNISQVKNVARSENLHMCFLATVAIEFRNSCGTSCFEHQPYCDSEVIQGASFLADDLFDNQKEEGDV